MALNYTITSSQIEAQVGSQVNLTTPTVTLTITPDTGYTVAAVDFSIGDPLPSEISGAVFNQVGANIECVLTLDNSFIMPASVVNLPVDIDGTAVPIRYTIAGNYQITTNNTSQVTGTTAYSNIGAYGDTITLFTVTFTADANHELTPDPSAVVSINNAYPDNYSISRTDTITSGRLTQVDYTVSYTINETENVSGDLVTFLVPAEEFLTPSILYYIAYEYKIIHTLYFFHCSGIK